MSAPLLRVISLGAGVQSTAMALMAAHGEIAPMPDCAIFADTGWEPKAVYEHLRWLMSPNVLRFPVHIVSAGNIRDEIFSGGSVRAGRFLGIPAHIRMDGGTTIGRRECTSHYKVEPIRRKIRDLLGVGKNGRIKPRAVEKWIGISLDEIIRATPAKVAFEENRFPLLEKRMSRGDCIEWMKRNGYPSAPKSRCIGCPLQSTAAWRSLKDGSLNEWNEAVAADKSIRSKTTKGEQFLHPSCVPLDEVDLSTAEDRGQLNLFNNECEGMCGV